MPEYQKMNPEVKAKWLEALRSGKYTQGQAVLKVYENGKPTYCCLGVLCDINPDLGEWKDEGDSTYRNKTRLRADTFRMSDSDIPNALSYGYAYIPHAMHELTGLDEAAQSELANLNDDRKLSFAEIADWIEENL